MNMRTFYALCDQVLWSQSVTEAQTLLVLAKAAMETDLALAKMRCEFGTVKSILALYTHTARHVAVMENPDEKIPFDMTSYLDGWGGGGCYLPLTVSSGHGGSLMYRWSAKAELRERSLPFAWPNLPRGKNEDLHRRLGCGTPLGDVDRYRLFVPGFFQGVLDCCRTDTLAHTLKLFHRLLDDSFDGASARFNQDHIPYGHTHDPHVFAIRYAEKTKLRVMANGTYGCTQIVELPHTLCSCIGLFSTTCWDYTLGLALAANTVSSCASISLSFEARASTASTSLAKAASYSAVCSMTFCRRCVNASHCEEPYPVR